MIDSTPAELFVFYIVAQSKVIVGEMPIWDSMHLRKVYSAAQLGDWEDRYMIQYLTQSHYTDISKQILALSN